MGGSGPAGLERRRLNASVHIQCKVKTLNTLQFITCKVQNFHAATAQNKRKQNTHVWQCVSRMQIHIIFCLLIQIFCSQHYVLQSQTRALCLLSTSDLNAHPQNHTFKVFYGSVL